jgi:hypothetical protein
LSDIFQEVEEDVRRERFEKLWQSYGIYAIAAAVLLLLGVAGYEVWQRYETGQREKDAIAFTAAQNLRDPAQAAKVFADLAAKSGGGYAELSRMEQANALLASGKRDPAAAIYKEVAASDSGPMGSVARLRAAWALADTASRDDLQKLLQPLLGADSAWKQLGQEILAYSDYRAGKNLIAASEFNQLAADPQTPDGVKGRAQALASFIANGAAANVGTVPEPAPPAIPASPPGAAPGPAPQ